ncbi:MAG: hypothetical protein R6W72_09785, partial [Desulfurivibrionaceae bacterium]
MEDVEMTSGFWQGKKVLITGHTGFKGSWLSLWLQQHGRSKAKAYFRKAQPPKRVFNASRPPLKT